jgi:hypothetical protein
MSGSRNICEPLQRYKIQNLSQQKVWFGHSVFCNATSCTPAEAYRHLAGGREESADSIFTVGYYDKREENKVTNNYGKDRQPAVAAKSIQAGSFKRRRNSSTLDMEAAGYSETSVYLHQTIVRHITVGIQCNRPYNLNFRTRITR